MNVFTNYESLMKLLVRPYKVLVTEKDVQGSLVVKLN